jgi:hypothetical protein
MRLLGLLLGVGLVLGLSAYVVSRVNAQGEQASTSAGVRVRPGGVVEPAPGSPTTGPGGPIDAARTVACATTAQTLRDAEETYRLLNGSYADLPTLIQSGTIRAPSEELYRIASTDGFATFRLVGEHGCP